MSAIPVPCHHFPTNSRAYFGIRVLEYPRYVACQRRFPDPGENRTDGKGISLSPLRDRATRSRLAGFFGLKHLRLELVALKQLIELGAIALRELCRLRHAAAGHAQDTNQVFALESASRLLERGELRGFFLERLLDERGGHDARGAERDHLLDHVDELPHVARPGC